MASPIMKYFAFSHLPPNLQEVSKPIGELAQAMDDKLPDGAEKSAGLRKLLEAKDCLVRAILPVLLFLFATCIELPSAPAAEIAAASIADYDGTPLYAAYDGSQVKDYDGTPPYLLASHRKIAAPAGTCRADGTGCNLASPLQGSRCGNTLNAGRCGILQGRVRSFLQRLVNR